MPDTPLQLVSQHCPKCGAESHYIVQMPIIDDVVSLAWFCRDCRHEWPVLRRDAGETLPHPKSLAS